MAVQASRVLGGRGGRLRDLSLLGGAGLQDEGGPGRGCAASLSANCVISSGMIKNMYFSYHVISTKSLQAKKKMIYKLAAPRAATCRELIYFRLL